MDRAAFLRSLDFLRPLPPGAWDGSVASSTDGNDDEDGGTAYSGSTITPPTPSSGRRDGDAMLSVFGGGAPLLAVVSIEPTMPCSEGRIDNGNYGENDRRRDADGRKRGRGDHGDFGATIQSGPAFFGRRHRPVVVTTDISETRHDVVAAVAATTAAAVAVANAQNAEVEPENTRRDDVVDEDETDSWNDVVNSDPSLCTFEAAIVRKISSAASELEELRGRRGGVLSTPDRYRRGTEQDAKESESKSLLFRFGNRFVFHVDESAIFDIKYEPGSSDGGGPGDGAGRNSEDRNGDEEKTNESSPPQKRHKNNGGDDGPTSRDAGNAQVGRKRLPPSLTISFGSCAFRVFSLECGIVENAAAAETTRPSSRIWGTLSKTAETAEDRLLNARSALVQHFDIDNGGRTRCRGDDASSVSSWRMAPPGSGLAFHSWPESFVTSSFHSNAATRKYNNTSLGFVEEGWYCCLGGKRTIACASAASSPQKSSSPSKSGSSGTNFEHGQKEGPQSKNESDNGNSGKHQHDEKDETFHQTSDLSHEHKKSVDELCGVELPTSQTSTSRNNDRESATNKKHRTTENGGCRSNQSEPTHITGNKEKGGGDEVDMESEGTNQQSWTEETRNKYRLFQLSAAHMELANPAGASSHQPGNVSVATHLSSCAESLANSYLSMEEFKERSQQFENDIGDATSEMESALV